MKKSDKNNRLILGGIDYSLLIKKYGTPLYVFEQDKIEKVIKSYISSLKENYGDGLICYASKAFCCKKIYSVISKFDMGADFVSLGEMWTAKKSHFNFNKAILHGNNKQKNELSFAVKNKIKYIVIDSIEEAKELNEICKKENKIQDVLVRVNAGVEAHTHHFIQTALIDSKFGFSLDNGDAFNEIKAIKKLKNLKLVGLHSHIGSQIFDVKSFTIAIEKLVKFYKKIKDEIKTSFSVLNLGGGFGIKYNDDDPNFTPQTYYDFVKEVSVKLKKEIDKYNLVKPLLILEPGRSIVGEAGTTLYTVGGVKDIKGVKKYISVDGGMFENPRFALYQARYKAVYPSDLSLKPSEKYTIAGKCCESGDIISEDIFLPKIKKGDNIAVLSTGAYNYSMASNYNRNLIPAVVFVKNGKEKLAVKRQTLNDLIKFDK